MCGIAGYCNLDKKMPVDTNKLKKMIEIIKHRGPDSEGIFIKDNIGLGHKRLSIIDLDSGDQPMVNSEKTIVITFNGEIYNYIELREELIKYGHSFRTTSDTEVIIKAYEQWGPDCLNRFNGCWAFALYDLLKNILFLSRDRMGEKPLYYAIYDRAFIFASEIKSIFSYGVPQFPDLDMTELYFGLICVPAPYTFYKNIYQVKPGHYLCIRNGIIDDFTFWRLPEIDEKNMLRNKNEINEEFEYLLEDSVKIRMRSDVPFGAFLSGGLDSSSIVALMAKSSNKPINTFTIGYNNKRYDETDLAAQVSKKFNTEHYIGTVQPNDFDEVINKTLFHYDGPFGDSSAIPTGQVSKLARQHVKMVLTGDGGDEVLSGYVSYQGIKLSKFYNKLPNILSNNIPSLISCISGPFQGNFRYKLEKLKKASKSANLDFNRRMLEKIPTIDLRTMKEMLPPSVTRISLEEYFSQIMSQCSYKDDFYKLMYFDFMHSLPNDMLTKVDRMSMASSLEVRIPFLDHRIIEFLIKVDKNIKMAGLERKTILKRTIGKSLPKAILSAPKKGFGIPLYEWFNSSQFSDKIDKLLNTDSGINKTAIQKIVLQNSKKIRDNGNFIWMLFLYDYWIKNKYTFIR